jgi:hypothetical protein
VSRAICGLSVFALAGCYLFHTPPEESTNAIADPKRSDGSCVVHSFTSHPKFDPIDMVWVVDSSRSMADEQDRIRQTINEFVSDIEQRNFDVHLVMITEQNLVPAPLGEDASRYLFVGRAVGSKEPLEALLDQLPRYQAFLRPEAALHFVVVTDDDSSLAADEFLNTMMAQLGRSFVLHAVASPDVDGSPCLDERASDACASLEGRLRATCGAAAIGEQYYTLADELGGEEISICVDDWGKVFGPLLEAVGRTEIPCTVPLGNVSAADVSVSLQLPGEMLPQLHDVGSARACSDSSGYYFLDGQVTLCPAACEATALEDIELRVSVDCD